MHGYHGRYLRIDVSTGEAQVKSLPESAARRFLGGVGLATWLLLRESPARIDPLAPEAGLVFAFSPLVGTPLTTSAKFAVAAKSPLTDRLNDSLSSSRFALSGKRTGADALLIVGRAERPSLLVIDDGRCRLEPADDVWGLEIPATQEVLRRRLGPDFDVAVIGPAGERQVRFATISHDRRHAGRGGLGAVMGAKNLKAIAVAGSHRCTLADPHAVVAAAKSLSERSFGPATAKYRELGTVANLLTFNRLNVLPTRNFQAGQIDAAEAISGEALHQARQQTRDSCAACTIGCEHVFRSSQGPVRLEYESLFALGPLCGITDPDTVLAAARRCDDLGLDTISTGATIAFTMECVERGLFDAPSLRFGQTDALLQTIEKIGQRRGFGDLLAEGTRRLAGRIGGEAPQFAPHVKGLEIPGYEPRALQTMALGFAVNSRGADHNRSSAYEVDFSHRVDRRKVAPSAAVWAVETEDKAALMDSLILCKFLRGVFSDLFAESADLLRLVTGWNLTAEELRQTARRIVTAKKLFNIREGWTPTEDTLPPRFLKQRLPDGTAPGAELSPERLEALKTAYYQERGWRPDGDVPCDLVAALDLTDVMPR
ncbi:MAG: aldehyde ferredoxin oxidoreductase family protein [Gemmataceae bacterium]|nr:aldehyde ferredoxin oxidoreductase family protein [Gemmataceae bacterium]